MPLHYNADVYKAVAYTCSAFMYNTAVGYDIALNGAYDTTEYNAIA